VALLPSLGADGRRPAFCGARSLRLRQRQAAPRRDARGLAEDGAQIRSSNEEFYRLYRQALVDMAALRLSFNGTDHMVFLPAAGLPWFVAPFGRDSLIVSIQNLLIYPEFARVRSRHLARCKQRSGTTIATRRPARSCTRYGMGSSRISS
jgi:glycogen debranching enzyme